MAKTQRKRTRKGKNKKKTYKRINKSNKERKPYKRMNKSNKKRKNKKLRGGSYSSDYYDGGYIEGEYMSFLSPNQLPTTTLGEGPPPAAEAAVAAAASEEAAAVASFSPQKQLPTTTLEEGLARVETIHPPPSNIENFDEEEKKYMEYLQEQAIIKDSSELPESDSIPTSELYKRLYSISDSSETTIEKSSTDSIDDSSEIMEARSKELPEEFLSFESMSADIISEDKFKLSPSEIKTQNTGVLRKLPKVLNSSSEIVAVESSCLCNHEVYHVGLNELFTDKLKIPVPKLPFTFATHDLHPDVNRYNIPVILSYMRGLVDLKNIRVYVNFNDYPFQNKFKENMFKIACPEKKCLYLWIPIKDYSAGNLPELIYWVHLCKYCRDNNMRMIYHCGSGCGRSPFMTLCNLLYMTKIEAESNSIELDVVAIVRRALSLVKTIAKYNIHQWDRLRDRIKKKFADKFALEELYKLMQIFFNNTDFTSFYGGECKEFLDIRSFGTAELMKNRLQMVDDLLHVEYDATFDPYESNPREIEYLWRDS